MKELKVILNRIESLILELKDALPSSKASIVIWTSPGFPNAWSQETLLTAQMELTYTVLTKAINFPSTMMVFSFSRQFLKSVSTN